MLLKQGTNRNLLFHCIVLYLLPVLNPKRVLEASGRPILALSGDLTLEGGITYFRGLGLIPEGVLFPRSGSLIWWEVVLLRMLVAWLLRVC